MSAEANRKIKDFIGLFQETWAECEAFRAKQKAEAAGTKANWQHCLTVARNQSEELFKPLFSAIRENAPIVRLLDSVRESLEASRRSNTKTVDQQTAPKLTKSNQPRNTNRSDT